MPGTFLVPRMNLDADFLDRRLRSNTGTYQAFGTYLSDFMSDILRTSTPSVTLCFPTPSICYMYVRLALHKPPKTAATILLLQCSLLTTFGRAEPIYKFACVGTRYSPADWLVDFKFARVYFGRPRTFFFSFPAGRKVGIPRGPGFSEEPHRPKGCIGCLKTTGIRSRPPPIMILKIQIKRFKWQKHPNISCSFCSSKCTRGLFGSTMLYCV